MLKTKKKRFQQVLEVDVSPVNRQHSADRNCPTSGNHRRLSRITTVSISMRENTMRGSPLGARVPFALSRPYSHYSLAAHHITVEWSDCIDLRDDNNETLLTGTNENSKPFMPDEKDNTNNDDVVSVLPITPLFGRKAPRAMAVIENQPVPLLFDTGASTRSQQ